MAYWLAHWTPKREKNNANHGYSCRKFSLLKGKDLQTRLFFGRFQTLEVLGNLWTSLIQRLSSEVVKIPAGENRYNLYITRKTLAGTVNSIADTLRT